MPHIRYSICRASIEVSLPRSRCQQHRGICPIQHNTSFDFTVFLQTSSTISAGDSGNYSWSKRRSRGRRLIGIPPPRFSFAFAIYPTFMICSSYPDTHRESDYKVYVSIAIEDNVENGGNICMCVPLFQVWCFHINTYNSLKSLSRSLSKSYVD